LAQAGAPCGHEALAKKQYAFDSAYLVEKGLISIKKTMIIDFMVN